MANRPARKHSTHHNPPHSALWTLRDLPRRASRRAWMGISAMVMLCCGLVGFTVTFSGILLLRPHSDTVYEVVATNSPFYAGSPIGPDAAASPLAGVFTPEVQYWAPLLQAWAVMYQVNPNLIATLVQIESCGDPFVSSSAGAQGLFQVMPFHFAPGEDMLDVQTNAKRGMEYLVDGLERADGHAGLALAGYNGGHGMIDRGWAAWSSQTQRYYYWGARIYAEAISGMETSPTLAEWLAAGGTNLCARANQSQQLLDAQAQENKQASTTFLAP